jgi:integrase
MPPEVAAHVAWLEQRGLARTTIYDRSRLLIRLAAFLPVPLLEASPEMLATWRASLIHAPGVICGYVSHATQFYAFAVTQGWITSNPAAGLPVPRRPRRLPRPVGEDDLERAVATAPARVRPWLALGGWAGFRAVEIANLRRESVLDSGPVPLLLVTAESTKGGRHERIVPMSPFVLAELRTAGLPGSGYVFRRMDGRPGPNRPHTITHLANEWLHECGIPETFHRFRHRFGSQLYMGTRDLRLVQEMLGHQDPATTAGYAAYAQDGAASAVASLRTPSRFTLVEGTAS